MAVWVAGAVPAILAFADAPALAAVPASHHDNDLELVATKEMSRLPHSDDNNLP